MNDDAPPRRSHPFVRAVLIAVCLFAAAFLFLILLAVLPHAFFEALLHFIAGWALFLHRNGAAVLRDPAILASGAVATVAALLLTHLLARKLAPGRWHWRASFAVLGFLFTGFAAAFLVPGVILILRTPMQGPWTEGRSGSERAFMTMETRNLCQALTAHAALREQDHYPASLGAVVRLDEFIDPEDPLAHAEERGFLYPGAGLPVDLEERFALLLSPAFHHRGETVRIVAWSDWSFEPRPVDAIEALLAETETLARRLREEAGR